MRRAAIAALLLGVGCSSEPEAGVPQAGFAGAWAEFMSPDDVRAALPLLEGRGVAVHMAWPAESIGDEALHRMVRDAAAAGVEVRPWLLLAEADGYWPGSSNAASFAEAAVALMDGWQAAGLAPTTLLVDMELRYDRATALQALLTAPEPDLQAVVDLLAMGIDPAQFSAATATYAELVDDAHARGWRVALTTLPQMLDDYADGDDQLRQAFGIPMDGIDWDVMTFQAYRTLFGDLLASLSDDPLTSYFVYDHARIAIELFGERAGVDIGLVAAGVTPSSVYAVAADLASDVEAALAAGVPRERIHVYNLDGIIDRAPSDAWLAAPPPDPAAPAEDEGTAGAHASNKALDTVL